MAFANTQHLNSVLSYILVKKMVERVESTKAYKLGLVDNTGKTKRVPDNETEESALTLLDKFIFKLKRMTGARINELSNFLYVNSLEGNMEDYLVVKGGAQNKGAIKRVSSDLNKLKEKYDLDTDELIRCLITEEARNK